MIPTIGTAVLSGGVVGFPLGLVGGGGSILATPLLLYLVGMAPHVAIGTSALAVSANAFINLIGHARNGNVRWRCAIVFALIGTLGALAGSTVGKIIDGGHLLFHRDFHQLVDIASPIEEGIIRMTVEMDESHNVRFAGGGELPFILTGAAAFCDFSSG